ncbi:Uma2 family endonuclease [Streptomyces millisiae]|uniref:Uma2 family endonuclease n=1 Tax=Streptomyces millisiae TaxID=3075542 RepID=A0ABU2M0R3_9ACTN|nr:Uma2 family endonuclease [Streptomyces sp. DSM 44918]MDT0322858.1 Uma2 family endonuclease [Streptomyces sp. DSM 44918]
MTVVMTDRIQMADTDDMSSDELFELLERAIPEGLKAEIVGGGIFVSPQRNTHWFITMKLITALIKRFGEDVLATSDVRVDFPGDRNAFCPDVVKFSADAAEDERGRFRYKDVEFVAEVISRGTAQNDYGKKREAYAAAGVPVYLIVDPYTRKCLVLTEPEGDRYREEVTVKFGDPVDLSGTIVDMVIPTDKFPHD